MKRKALFSIMILALVHPVVAEGIGMTPSSTNLGEIERGTSEEVTVLVSTTGYEQPFTVRPEYSRPMIGNVVDSQLFDEERLSEQEISSWISFDRDVYTIDPTDKITANGEAYSGRINFTINVPQDAEPGYHGGMLNLEFTEEAQELGFGASFRGVGLYRFSFQVPGTAYRDIQYNTRVLRTGRNEITVVNRFVNQGSVTASIRDIEFNLTQVNGGFSRSMNLGHFYVPEGGAEVVAQEVTASGIEAGNYRIEGSADFLTGSAIASDSFSLSDIVDVEPGDLENESDGTGSFDNQSLPLWLVVMLLIMVGVLMYSFGIDPIWILVAVGVIGISIFILTTSVPNVLLIVFLIVTGGLIYYGVM